VAVIGELKPNPEYQPSGSPWLGAVPAHWQVRPAFGAYSPTGAAACLTTLAV
jgi:hypothetical protein